MTTTTQHHRKYLGKWTNTLIHTIWSEVRKLWDIRNDARHGKDEEAKLERQLEQAQRETNWLYGFRSACSANVRDIIFHQNTAQHFIVENTLARLRAWIQLHKSTILAVTEPDERPRVARIHRTRSQLHRRQKHTSSVQNQDQQPTPQMTGNGILRSAVLSQTYRPRIHTRIQTGLRQMRTTMAQWLRPSSQERDTNNPSEPLLLPNSLQQGIPKVKMKQS